MDTEFINAYIQRMLALNNELTNKNVMLETKLVLLETKYNTLAQAYNALVENAHPSEDVASTDVPAKKADKKQEKQNESF